MKLNFSIEDFSGLQGFSLDKTEIIVIKKTAAHKFYLALSVAFNVTDH